MEMEEYSTGTPRPRRRPSRSFMRWVMGVVAVLLVFILGAVGGVSGFVLLANGNSSFVQNLRHHLGLDSNSSVSIPVTQSVKLEESSAVIDASKKVSPAVVSIVESQQVATDFFGTSTTSQEVAGGTGFIITSDGLIMTNKHVVSDTGGSYKVILADGRNFDAKIQALDPLNDLAVVKIDAKDLPTVELGDSSALQVGQHVLAIGNALGEFQNSVTLGVVSAFSRSIEAGSDSGDSTEQLTNLIQTDTAINPGNSGGPLVNMDGQVVGINTAEASDAQGIGFSIPINAVKPVIDSVRKTGQIIRPYLGVRYVAITAQIQQYDNLAYNYGVLVERGQTPGEVAVLPGSPADKAGLKENDIILSVNGEHIDDKNSLQSLIAKYNVGDTVTLHISRTGKEQDVKVTLDKLNS